MISMDDDDDDNDSGDDVDFAMDTEDGCTRSKQPRLSNAVEQDDYYDEEENQYEVFSVEEISQQMCDAIKEVNQVIRGLSITTTRLLLNYFHWDKEKLMEKFFDGEPDELFKEAKIMNPLKKRVASSASNAAKHGSLECPICMQTFESESDLEGLECGHKFCYVCWDLYLTSKIIDTNATSYIECPYIDCSVLVEDEYIEKSTIDEKYKSKYRLIITENFVASVKTMRWCPAKDCNLVVKVSCSKSMAVTCRCGLTFCFECGLDWHEPVKCALLKKWLKKCDDDSETSNWIAANTKECPRCGATIEKDGGCNHMICKNQNCKADFCWVCLGPWEPHGSSWYNCNRYDEEEAKAARDSQEKSRSALQKYLFYCNRYLNHMQSLRFENKLYASVKDKMDEMQQRNLMTWIEVQFLKKAVDVLLRCRQTLMYTYVFAYYVIKNNQCQIFEENQKDLERATEILSEFLERDMTTENLDDIKRKVLDRSRYCEGRRLILLEHVSEGYENEWWELGEG